MSDVPAFAEIVRRASAVRGSLAAVEADLPACLSVSQLAQQPDSFYLSTMTRRIFQAGLKHSVVNQRWPQFEAAFAGFDVRVNAMMSDDDLDRHMVNDKLIRHHGKMKSIRHNAAMVLETAQQYGGFGRFLADWPASEVVELWRWLKRQGNQLGGMSGARFLRLAGVDTFLLTDDVVAALSSFAVVTKTPTARRDLLRVQQVFNEWQAESGRPLCEISRIVSYTVNPR